MEKMIDLKGLTAEADAEDAAVMAFFQNRRERIDNKVLLVSNGSMKIVSKDDIAAARKKFEDNARFAAVCATSIICMTMMLCIRASVGNVMAWFTALGLTLIGTAGVIRLHGKRVRTDD